MGDIRIFNLYIIINYYGTYFNLSKYYYILQKYKNNQKVTNLMI